MCWSRNNVLSLLFLLLWKSLAVRQQKRLYRNWYYSQKKLPKIITTFTFFEAINGSSFCKAGKEAFRLLVSNALRVTAINSLGDFVLFLGKVYVVIITVFIALTVLHRKAGVQHIWVLATLLGLIAYFISHCFLTVYEV